MGENIQVWIDPVVFNDLLNWLNALDEKYALRVTQIDASAAEKTGMVNVQRLEFGRGVKYQEISINKITLVNVARVIPPRLYKQTFFVKVIVRSKSKNPPCGRVLKN